MRTPVTIFLVRYDLPPGGAPGRSRNVGRWANKHDMQLGRNTKAQKRATQPKAKGPGAPLEAPPTGAIKIRGAIASARVVSPTES